MGGKQRNNEFESHAPRIIAPRRSRPKTRARARARVRSALREDHELEGGDDAAEAEAPAGSAPLKVLDDATDDDDEHVGTPQMDSAA